MHIIIDADPIVYRAGFAAETHSYDVVYEGPDGELGQALFVPEPKKSAGDKMKDFFSREGYTILDKEKIVDCEPLSYALRGVKMTIEACIADAKKHGIEALGCGSVQPHTTVLLSGPGNFRYDIATIKPYKGNRDKDHRPVYYQQIRDYLCHNWGARVVEGHEADDECSILAGQMEDKRYVVCSIDKDLDQIPGFHYDYAKKVFYEIEEDNAEYVFWKQCISGDSVDNIMGCYRIGDARAEKLLAGLLDKAGDDRSRLWQYVVDLYADTIEKNPDKYPEGMTAEEAALETARLVKMQDYHGQLWEPPGIPDSNLEDFYAQMSESSKSLRAEEKRRSGKKES